MDFVEILGLCAAIITTAANIPQTVKVIKTRSTKSLSSITYSMLFTGLTLWFIYGLKKNDLPIILGNGIAAALCGIILTIKLMALFRHNKPNP